MTIGAKTFRSGWIFLACFVVLSISLLGYRSNQKASASAVEKSHAWKPAVEAKVKKAVENLETLTALIEELKNNGVPDRDTLNSMLKAILRNNPNYLATWSCWKPDALDNLDYQYENNIGHDQTGRFIPYWNRLDGQIDVVPLTNYDELGWDDTSNVAYKSGKTIISQPIEYQSKNKSLHKIVITAPIHFDDQVVGIVGIDIPMEDS